ncbi:MAG: SocA family protein [Spirulina sp. SIO3F2]|nr:SocA family protein [Spirulina sp. SIO3F2]
MARPQNDIWFKFDPLKVVDAATLLLEKHGGRMKWLGLMKLLYIADKLTLEETGQSISGDFYVSMPFGPVMSQTYDLIRSNPAYIARNKLEDALLIWNKYIEKDEAAYEVVLRTPSNYQMLSRRELRILSQVYEEKGKSDEFELVDLTHGFPEWEDPREQGVNSLPLPISRVLTLLETSPRTEEEIESLRQEMEGQRNLEELLGD